MEESPPPPPRVMPSQVLNNILRHSTFDIGHIAPELDVLFQLPVTAFPTLFENPLFASSSSSASLVGHARHEVASKCQRGVQGGSLG